MIVVGEDLTKENIFKYVTSYDIFRRYSRHFTTINKSFLSDFRDEKHPSCRVTFLNGDLIYTDFGLGKSFRAIDFVMTLYDISYIGALQKINQDFGLNLGLCTEKIDPKKKKLPVNRKNSPIYKEKTTTIINIKRRGFEKHDIEFWGRFGIKQSTLELFNVVPINHFWINGTHFLAPKYSYSYNFYFENGIFRRKIYQPFSKTKWLSNGGKIVQGEVILPNKGELLIVTKALKDVMTLYELGYTAVAPSAETMFLPENYFKKQSKRFKRVVLFYDNDGTGKKFSHKFAENYGISKEIFIPKEYNCKDISDFVFRYGIKKAKVLVKTLLT